MKTDFANKLGIEALQELYYETAAKYGDVRSESIELPGLKITQHFEPFPCLTFELDNEDSVYHITIAARDGVVLYDPGTADVAKARKMLAIVERSLDAAVTGNRKLRSARTHAQASAARSAFIRDREQIEIGLQAWERLSEFVDDVAPESKPWSMEPFPDDAEASVVVWPKRT
jgi:hypothetical protein